jgi:phosphatidate phosphatase APP1
LSYVTDHKKLFESSFFKDFVPVDGMPELYQQWQIQGAKFHYVSSSPWQFYEPLDEFMQAHGFPEATMSLKKIRFKDETFFNLFKSATKTKPQAINAIIKKYPDRKYVLLGDSGEKDAQVYAQIANEHPEKISKIYIRNVNGAENLEILYEMVFDGLPRDLWQVFEQPKEIQSELTEL